MALFNITDRVIDRSSQEMGVVIIVYPLHRGRQFYKVNFSNNEREVLENDLKLYTDITDPFERYKQGLLDQYEDFARINTSFKIRNVGNDAISSLKASKTIFKAYQFKPLLKFLNSPNRRILIADEVGLGKTIEAGHIMMELAARKELGNALIICPNAIVEKWREELQNRFGFTFTICDSTKEIIKALNDHDGSVRLIINYEKIRPQYEAQKNDEIKKIKKGSLIEYILSNDKKFNFVVCDESHRLRNENTQLYKGAQYILNNTISAIFLSATPIMIGEENLFNQLRLLDQQRYSQDKIRKNSLAIFKNELSANKPFIAALSELNDLHQPLSSIADSLENSKINIYYSSGEENETIWNKTDTVKQQYSDIELYKNIINNLRNKSDTSDTRVQLQYDISSLSPLNNIFSRTRKRDVTTDWSQAERRPVLKRITLSQNERENYEQVIDEYITRIDDETNGAILGLIQKKRCYASSVYANMNDPNDLDKGIDKYLTYQDAKVEALLSIIKEVVEGDHKKIIVFAIFKNTIKYLQIRLKNSGYNVASIHGDIDVKERISEIQRFKNDESVPILLSTEVGSEGLDLQFCDALVNYDLPWNPMIVEQRIGRIDRFGQTSPVVNIYNFVVKNSIQEMIYDRLLDRIDIFRTCIGDLEAILNKEQADNRFRNIQEGINNLEKELYCTELTPEQRRDKIQAIEQAIIREQQNLKEVSEGLTDTLTNDLYFKNEIERILTNRKYVTEEELVNYLNTLIKLSLSTCTLEQQTDKSQYSFRIPTNTPKILTNFLTTYMPRDLDYASETQFFKYKNSIQDKLELIFTFNQEMAFSNPQVTYINAYHPIILAARQYFEQLDGNKVKKTFVLTMLNNKFKNSIYKFDNGVYIMAVYILKAQKTWLGSEQQIEMQIPILYSVVKNQIIEDRKCSEYFLGEVQVFGQNQNGNITLVDSNIIENLRFEFVSYFSELRKQYINDEKMRLESSIKLQLKRLTESFDNRINMNERILENQTDSKTIQLYKGIIQNIMKEKEEQIEKIESGKIEERDPELYSLSQITII